MSYLSENADGIWECCELFFSSPRDLVKHQLISPTCDENRMFEILEAHFRGSASSAEGDVEAYIEDCIAHATVYDPARACPPHPHTCPRYHPLAESVGHHYSGGPSEKERRFTTEDVFACPVCMEEHARTLAVVVVQCGDVACARCTIAALVTMSKCPLCGEELSGHHLRAEGEPGFRYVDEYFQTWRKLEKE